MRKSPLHLFCGYGIELEYMIVDSDTLDVMPVSDSVLASIAGKRANDAEVGTIGLSNEFVLHVLEMRNILPVSSLSDLPNEFKKAVTEVNRLLGPLGGVLMPTAMHPWMDPKTETRLWPHRYRRVYRTYDRIFDCRNHGWANVQSSQINLSFSGDTEFRALHAAVRFLLPILPALAASSPVVDGRVSGALDNRLFSYRNNQTVVPSITGALVPEAVYTEKDYREKILARMYSEIAPHDPEGVLRHEWLNSRGAIPRFDRSAIEVRVLDVQEYPAADVAIAALVSHVLKKLTGGKHAPLDDLAAWETGALIKILDETTRLGEKAVVKDRDYLKALGLGTRPVTALTLWRRLAEDAATEGALKGARMKGAIDVILVDGPLARRMLRAIGKRPTRERLREVYARLPKCLAKGVPFRA